MKNVNHRSAARAVAQSWIESLRRILWNPATFKALLVAPLVCTLRLPRGINMSLENSAVAMDRPRGGTYFPCPVDPSLHCFPDLHLCFPEPCAAPNISFMWRKKKYTHFWKVEVEDSLSQICKIVFGKRRPVTRESITRTEGVGAISNRTVPSSADAAPIQPRRAICCRSCEFASHRPHVARCKAR